MMPNAMLSSQTHQQEIVAPGIAKPQPHRLSQRLLNPNVCPFSLSSLQGNGVLMKIIRTNHARLLLERHCRGEMTPKDTMPCHQYVIRRFPRTSQPVVASLHASPLTRRRLHVAHLRRLVRRRAGLAESLVPLLLANAWCPESWLLIRVNSRVAGL